MLFHLCGLCLFNIDGARRRRRRGRKWVLCALKGLSVSGEQDKWRRRSVLGCPDPVDCSGSMVKDWNPPKQSQGSARSGRYFNDMRADIWQLLCTHTCCQRGGGAYHAWLVQEKRCENLSVGIYTHWATLKGPNFKQLLKLFLFSPFFCSLFSFLLDSYIELLLTTQMN